MAFSRDHGLTDHTLFLFLILFLFFFFFTICLQKLIFTNIYRLLIIFCSTLKLISVFIILIWTNTFSLLISDSFVYLSPCYIKIYKTLILFVVLNQCET